MERRRLLDNDGYIAWLKSIGCLLYLPLSYNGDLTDRISGQSLILSGNGSMVWNVAEQMYMFTMPSVLNASIAELHSSLTKTDFPTNNYSSLITMKMITNSSSKAYYTLSPMSTDATTIASTSASSAGNRYSNMFPHYVCKHAYVSDHSTGQRRYYYDGVLTNTLAEYAGFLPSNWVMSGTGAIFGNSIAATCYGTQYYAKEVYLFNVALDIDTIKQIQQI